MTGVRVGQLWTASDYDIELYIIIIVDDERIVCHTVTQDYTPWISTYDHSVWKDWHDKGWVVLLEDLP